LKDRCNLLSPEVSGVDSTFQSSPALKDRCNPLRRQKKTKLFPRVSILTGLERPVQHYSRRLVAGNPKFQSSPALKDRCNARSGCENGKIGVFQSSPALKDRCNLERLACPALDGGGFNPHRP